MLPLLIPAVRQILFSQSFDYYIDSINGSDSNTGRKSSPFATLDAITALATLKPKARIGIKRGSVLYSSLTVTGNDISVKAYGSGAAPIIDCRDTLTSGSWTLSAGKIYTYECTVTLPNDVKSSGNIWEDNDLMSQVTSIALCESTPGTAYMSSWTGATATLYIHPSDNGNPGSNGKSYKYSRRLSAIYLNGDRGLIHGITTIGNAHQDGSIRAGRNTRVEFCRIEDGSRHSCFLQGGSIVSDTYFYRAKNDLEGGLANHIVFNENDMSTSGFMVNKCTFDAGGIATVTALSFHDAVQGRLVGYGYVNDCTFIGCNVSTALSQNLVFNNPIFNDVINVISVSSPDGVVTLNNPQGRVTTRIISASTSSSITINGGYISCAQVNNGIIYNSSTSESLAVNIINTEINLESVGAANWFAVVINKGSLALNGAKFYPKVACPFSTFFKVGNSAVGTITGNNNTYPLGVNWSLNGTTYNTISTFSAANGSDTASSYWALPNATFSDNFDVSDTNLENLSGWTRIDGASGQAAIRSNKLAHVSGTQTAYATAEMLTNNMYAKAKVASSIPVTPMSFPLALRLMNNVNYLGARWSMTAWQTYKVISGVYTQTGSVVAIPSENDVVIFACRDGYSFLYVNNAMLIGPTPLNDVTLTSKKAGTVVRAVQDPAFDDFSCGDLT